jgi:peptidoglycan biosynthesis protein MviN/MurJ (putative lipid II flippase)
MLATLRAAKLGFAVMSLMLYGRLFGIGLRMDAWVFASSLVAAAGMMAWGPVNEIARSRFLQQVARDGFAAAAQGATRLLRVTALGSALMALLLWFAGPWLLSILYVGAQHGGGLLVLRVFALMLPSLVLSQILALGSAYLNCCAVIYAPEWIGVGAALVSLVSVYGLEPALGVYSLVVGYYLGLLLSVGSVLLLLMRRRFLGASWRPLAGPAVFDYLWFSAPLFLSYGAGQANGLLEKTLASSLGVGMVASVNYSSQIKATLQAVITSVLFSIAVPRLTQAANDGAATPSFAVAWRDVQRVVVLFLVAVVPPLWGGANLIAVVLFGKGRVSVDQLALISGLIRSYLIALVPVSLYLVHGVALLAQQKSRSYAVWGVAAQLLSAAFSLALVSKLGAQAFPLALLLSHSLAAVAMARVVGPSRQLWVEFAGWLGMLTLYSVLIRALAFWTHMRISSALPALMLVAVVHGAALGGAIWWYRARQKRGV